MNFSGSYDEGQVNFIVNLIENPNFVSINEKELNIQTGTKHYGEMLSIEKLPTQEYMEIYYRALSLNGEKMALHCLALASRINNDRPHGVVTLVSLMRAGTPVGVIVRELLTRIFHRHVDHYSISIIRDKGVDQSALRYILSAGNPDTSLLFIDGWTGKGVITRELKASIKAFNSVYGTMVDSSLYVLADIAGSASFSATNEDYLIPSCILNSTISGLVSRSLLNSKAIEQNFHSCYFYNDFFPADQSKTFVSSISNSAVELFKSHGIPFVESPDNLSCRLMLNAYLSNASEKYLISDLNLIKPGIGEATRVLLRRVPKRLIVKDQSSPDVVHLINLALNKDVPIEIDTTIPFKAVSLIGSSLDG